MRGLVLLILLFTAESLFAASLKQLDGAVVFMYHRFGENSYPSTSIKMEQFEFQLEYLKKHHYNVWPLSKIVRTLQNKQSLPPKTVALTMDDAYKSVYTRAFPLLKKYGFPFTVFVNTEPVERHFSAFMTWAQMREMQCAGAEFGNHTKSHISFVSFLYLDKEQMREKIEEEIEGAQKKLRNELGDKYGSHIKMLAYPYGEYTNKIRDIVNSLGYVACAQMGGVVTTNTNLAEIPRFPMSQRFATKKGFVTKLRTKALPLAYPPQSDHLVVQNPPVLTLALQRSMKNLGCFEASGERIEMQWLDPLHVRMQASKLLKPPRDHYTCTAKARDGKWYWYSFFWVFPKGKSVTPTN